MDGMGIHYKTTPDNCIWKNAFTSTGISLRVELQFCKLATRLEQSKETGAVLDNHSLLQSLN
jgi:hypothetical protein